MRKAVFFLLIICLFSMVLYVGYYETRWGEEEDPSYVFFIKKTPTLKIRFVNIFATESEDHSKLHKVNEVDRQFAVDYCKYHLGIEIEMKTQAEMDRCEQVFYSTLKKPPQR